MALIVTQIAHKVDSLKRQYSERDGRMGDILAVREGKLSDVYPEMFPEGMNKAMVANFVDVVAKDLSELLAPLPSFNCSTLEVNNESAKRRADKRTLIANSYIFNSSLETQMYAGADYFLSYAFMPIIVEPDFDLRMPRIRVECPVGAYPEYDRFGRCVSYSKVYKKTLGQLIADYPEYASQLMQGESPELINYDKEMGLVWYHDKDQTTLYIPESMNLVLESAKNPIGKMMMVVPKRPSLNPDNPRGQFDDVLWVQIARARFSMLALEAVEKSVQAPLSVPNDVDDFAFGPDAIIRTNSPQSVRRVGLELPMGAFQEQTVLGQEMRMGARYPEGRSGTIDANIITGQGVQALLGSFDTQVKAAQQIFSQAFEQLVSLCFEIDEKLFPEEKQFRGVLNGAPYLLKYSPATDIAGDYTVQVRYGLMSGLDPSRALIFSLQALQAKLVSRDFVMRELPWSMNVAVEQERIDIESMRDNLAQSISALAQAIPQMAASGQGDPAKLVERIAKTINLRKKGTPIEDAVQQVFAQPEQAPVPEQTPAGVAAPVEQTPNATQQAPENAPPAGQPQPPNVASILARLGGMGG
jgi:hypothetical protein